MDRGSVSKQTLDAIQGLEVLSGNHTALSQARGSQGRMGHVAMGSGKEGAHARDNFKGWMVFGNWFNVGENSTAERGLGAEAKNL